MLGSPMLLGSLLGGTDFASTSRVSALLGLLFLLGWMCSAIGLRLLRATGDSALGKGVFVLQMIGLLLAGSQQVQDLIQLNPNNGSFFYSVSDAAWPLSVLFMLVVGIFTLKTKVWEGWRRFAPLLCGFALPVMLVVSGLAGKQAGIIAFGIYTMVAWMLLGYAVRTGSQEALR